MELIVNKQKNKIFKFLLIYFLLFFSFLYGNSNKYQLIYEIYDYNTSKNILYFSLELNKNIKNKKLFLRGRALGVDSQVKNLRCENKTIKSNKNQEWDIPKTCNKIFWEVKLKKEIKQVSNQTSGIVKSTSPIILLNEFSSMPRLDKNSYISILKNNTFLKNRLLSPFSQNKKGDYILPSIDNAPAFLIIDLYSKSSQKKEANLKYIIDNQKTKNYINKYYSQHKKAIKYIYSLFDFLDYREFKSTVLWIGLKKQNFIGGVAGYRTFLVNYIIDDKLEVKRFPYSFTGAIHEQFHTIYPINNTIPTWVSESLAQYYAIKTMEKINFDSDKLKNIKKRFFHTTKNTIGLKEANNRFISKNDMSVYGLFYTKGSSFWFDLDNLIKKSTNKSLDDFMGALSQMNFPPNYNLPNDFIKLLEKNNIKQEDIKKLLSKYL